MQISLFKLGFVVSGEKLILSRFFSFYKTGALIVATI